MLIIGLTGGIGSGKSTAAEYFLEKGFAHIDADLIAHEITAEGMPIIDVLQETFGPGSDYNKDNIEILDAPGKLNRRAMARVAFADDMTREKFDNIMFAEIIRVIEKRIAEIEQEDDQAKARGERGYDGILIDAPLLFESEANELCDLVILITADMEERITRVAIRDKATRKEIQSRIDSQYDDDIKAKLADFVVDNNGTVENLYEKLDEIRSNFC